MKKVVVLNHNGSWYNVYGDGAKIVAYITNYKLFEDYKTSQPKVSFPDKYIDDIVYYLKKNKINYMLKNDDNKVIDFGKENRFDNFINKNVPYSYISNNNVVERKLIGSFKVQFSGEEIEEYIIDKNINSDAELVKKVFESNVGETILINDYKVLIIEKNIKY